ncbi:hypothetical protein H5410_036840, partial [Solanum commersonii]
NVLSSEQFPCSKDANRVNKIKNVDILHKVRVGSTVHKMLKARLRLFGHVLKRLSRLDTQTIL